MLLVRSQHDSGMKTFADDTLLGIKYTKPVKLAHGQYVYASVYRYDRNGGEGNSGTTMYSIIQARPPSTWDIDHWVKVGPHLIRG